MVYHWGINGSYFFISGRAGSYFFISGRAVYISSCTFLTWPLCFQSASQFLIVVHLIPTDLSPNCHSTSFNLRPADLLGHFIISVHYSFLDIDYLGLHYLTTWRWAYFYIIDFSFSFIESLSHIPDSLSFVISNLPRHYFFKWVYISFWIYLILFLGEVWDHQFTVYSFGFLPLQLFISVFLSAYFRLLFLFLHFAVSHSFDPNFLTFFPFEIFSFPFYCSIYISLICAFSAFLLLYYEELYEGFSLSHFILLVMVSYYNSRFHTISYCASIIAQVVYFVKFLAVRIAFFYSASRASSSVSDSLDHWWLHLTTID